jgi:hypothetical protein
LPWADAGEGAIVRTASIASASGMGTRNRFVGFIGYPFDRLVFDL